jgi:hypothetical protein
VFTATTHQVKGPTLLIMEVQGRKPAERLADERRGDYRSLNTVRKSRMTEGSCLLIFEGSYTALLVIDSG